MSTKKIPLGKENEEYHGSISHSKLETYPEEIETHICQLIIDLCQIRAQTQQESIQHSKKYVANWLRSLGDILENKNKKEIKK